MKFFHKLRCKLARRRFERALDSVSAAEFERMCAMQVFFHENVMVPGDRIVITFNQAYGVDILDAENSNQQFNHLENDLDL